MFKKKSLLIFFRLFLHVLLIFVIFGLSYIIRQKTDLIPLTMLEFPYISGYDLTVYTIISAFLFVFRGIVKKYYNINKATKSNSFLKTRGYRSISITFLAYFGHGFIFGSGISRLIIVWSIVLVGIFLPIVDYFTLSKINRLLSKNLIIYQDKNTIKDKKIQKLMGIFVHIDELDRVIDGIQTGTTEVLSGIDKSHYHQNTDINLQDINNIIIIGDISKGNIEKIFDQTRGKDVSVYHLSDNFFIKDIIFSSSDQDGLHLIHYKASTIDERNLIIKRIFDIFVSLVGLILLSPFFVIIAILIKTDSKGPIFYTQKRVGKGGKLFNFIKFRSMFLEDCVGEKYGGKLANQKYQKLIQSNKNVRKGILSKFENDTRVTKIGKFIRRTSIDELPSLRIVLIGDMSIVGPRPHMTHEIEQYENRHKRLLSIKPGITGYAQINGRDELNFDDEANFDLYYIQNRNIFLDIYIIFMTIQVSMKGK